MEEERLENYRFLPKEKKVQFLNSLVESKDEDTASLLKELYDLEEDKELLKLIRRLLFRLRTQGIKVESPKQKGEIALKRIRTEPKTQAYLTSYDSLLKRACILSKERKKGLILIFHAIMSLKEGLEEVSYMEMETQEFSSWIRSYRESLESDGILFLNISPKYAFLLLEEAERRSKRFKREIDLLHKTFDIDMDTSEVKSPRDLYDLLGEQKGEEQRMDLFSHPMFKNLILSWEGIEEDVKAYSDQKDSILVLPSHILEERKRGFLEDLVNSERLRTLRDDFRRILEDYAYMAHLKGLTGLLSEILKTLKEQKLFDEYLKRSISASLDMRLRIEESKPRLILRPEEVLSYGKVRS